MVAITHVLHPGVVYLCNYIKGTQTEVPENKLEEQLALLRSGPNGSELLKMSPERAGT